MTLYIMKSPIKTSPVYFIKWVFVSVLLIMLTGCDGAAEIPKEPIRTVRVEAVSANTALMQRRFTGRIDAVSTVDLSFQVPGRLIKLPAKEGVFIAKGSVIAALDQNDFRLAVEQAKAQFDLAKLDLTRKRNLLQSGSLPKVMLDQAETSYKLTQVALETAQRNQSYTQIIAPFDALLSQRLIDNYTNVGAHQPIVRVQDLTELRVRINIPENMVSLLERASDFKAEGIFKDRPEQRFPLSYREHMTEASSVAQTYEVIFGLSRKEHQQVLPGMTVIVIISQAESRDAPQLAIPVSAIDYDEQGAARVWVFNPQTETVSARKVILGTIKKQKIPVLSGLQQDEQIVTAGAHLLREGISVRRFVAF
ncbi:MAG: efflux RND transporter periplasmic adaptor subunit [Methyloprofundus sp.]|nr:efflux RND transporter periplasmic adaptor subunit [Methyloprofundus sp.]MDT8425549.1 efflux RND transporter periplasmic adaptor subunit [Methyloprofundus sp.]